MQELLINKLHQYISENNPDLLIMLEEKNETTLYLNRKIQSIDNLIAELTQDDKPEYIIEETCMDALIKDLRPGKYNYIKNILEQEFEYAFYNFHNRPARGAAVGVAALVFCGLILLTAATNDATAFVAAGKLVEVAALGLGVAVLLHTREQFDALIELVLLVTIAADVVGVVNFVSGGGGRQASFLGEHDFAALASLPLVYGLVLLADRDSVRAWVAIGAGGVGVTLGAALASLSGLYLGTVALLAVAILYHVARPRQLVAILAVVAAVTAGTLFLRSSDLGFLQSWFGKPPSRPGQYASSWSQRLIYAYIGGRIFLAHPLVGTGWYGELPPKTFVVYLPDARRRFSDQPARYFPSADRPFIPQQAFDQVLYELGIAGALAFLALLTTIGRAAFYSAKHGVTAVRSLPAAWLAATVGALAGEGLFGGTPVAATLALVAGIAVAFASRPRKLA